MGWIKQSSSSLSSTSSFLGEVSWQTGRWYTADCWWCEMWTCYPYTQGFTWRNCRAWVCTTWRGWHTNICLCEELCSSSGMSEGRKWYRHNYGGHILHKLKAWQLWVHIGDINIPCHKIALNIVTSSYAQMPSILLASFILSGCEAVMFIFIHPLIIAVICRLNIIADMQTNVSFRLLQHISQCSWCYQQVTHMTRTSLQHDCSSCRWSNLFSRCTPKGLNLEDEAFCMISETLWEGHSLSLSWCYTT